MASSVLPGRSGCRHLGCSPPQFTGTKGEALFLAPRLVTLTSGPPSGGPFPQLLPHRHRAPPTLEGGRWEFGGSLCKRGISRSRTALLPPMQTDWAA